MEGVGGWVKKRALWGKTDDVPKVRGDWLRKVRTEKEEDEAEGGGWVEKEMGEEAGGWRKNKM